MTAELEPKIATVLGYSKNSHRSGQVENALDLAEVLSQPTNAVIVLDGWPAELASLAIVGMQLRKSPVLAFRAVAEDWTLERAIQELN